MNSDKSTEQTLSSGGKNTSATHSIALLSRRLGTSPAPRMLTRSEIDLLRQSKVEVDRIAGEVLASKDSTSRK